MPYNLTNANRLLKMISHTYHSVQSVCLATFLPVSSESSQTQPGSPSGLSVLCLPNKLRSQKSSHNIENKIMHEKHSPFLITVLLCSC